jgi:prophage DNA circulation protein
MSGAIGTIGSLIQSAGRFANAFDTSSFSWAGGAWYQQLQPASWRGVGFILDAAHNQAGRRTAVHEYPYRDTVWVEDLGKTPRRFEVQGFLVGDDVYSQRDQMVQACETQGPGTLVHPTMGVISVALLEFAITDRRERGRYVECSFVFIAAGDVLFPTLLSDAGDLVLQGASALGLGSVADLKKSLSNLVSVPLAAIQPALSFAKQAVSAANDAARAFNAVRGVVGLFGRYASGKKQGFLPLVATVSSALSAATAARSTVLTSAASLVSIANRI